MHNYRGASHHLSCRALNFKIGYGEKTSPPYCIRGDLGGGDFFKTSTDFKEEKLFYHNKTGRVWG